MAHRFSCFSNSACVESPRIWRCDAQVPCIMRANSRAGIFGTLDGGGADRLMVSYQPAGRPLLAGPASGNRLTPVRGGKSGLHGNTVAANGRRGRPQGKCHRKQTAEASSSRQCVPRTQRAGVAARMKGCGKSAPRRRRRRRQGKPHREQNRIGMVGREATRRQVRFQTNHPGWLLEGASNGVPRRMAVAGASPGAPRQNPAYRPAGLQFPGRAYCGALTNMRTDLPDSIWPAKNFDIAGRSAVKVKCCVPLPGAKSLR